MDACTSHSLAWAPNWGGPVLIGVSFWSEKTAADNFCQQADKLLLKIF